MSKEKDDSPDEEMRPVYDFSAGVRGKYAEGTNVVVLDPDVARVFPDAESVNRALRALAEIIEAQRTKAVAGARP